MYKQESFTGKVSTVGEFLLTTVTCTTWPRSYMYHFSVKIISQQYCTQNWTFCTSPNAQYNSEKQ